MVKKIRLIPIITLMVVLFASACSPSFASLPAEASEVFNRIVEDNAIVQDEDKPAALESQSAEPIEPGLLAAYENTLINIYDQVNPSVVNIRVVSQALPNTVQLPDFPDFFPDLPQMPDSPNFQPPTNESLGSGFVWDTQGNIITNNHVVEGAEKIEVTFADETVVEAELVGADPDSDLAVIRVDLSANQLHPVQMGDSDQLRVGQLAIAIGNPFGLEGTMTVGIVSALGRSLPASDGLTAGAVYSIPNVIQTDAPINPGNSGGVLLNDVGEVIGVTAAIESPVRANAGVGFVIPASIVQQVVPELISNGTYSHPYLGISGISLFPDLAEAMDLDRNQRGAMVAEVVPDGPADKAGLQGSGEQVSIDSMEIGVGGDVIISIDSQAINGMDDLIAYLSANVKVGQEVTLTVLREGREVDIEVKIEARPKDNPLAAAAHDEINGQAWLGIYGLPMSPAIAKEMDLPEDTQGVLIIQVQEDSPAELAGLHGGDSAATIEGEQILIGGDIITAVDEIDVETVQELAEHLQKVGVGAEVGLSVIRDGKQINIDATLSERP